MELSAEDIVTLREKVQALVEQAQTEDELIGLVQQAGGRTNRMQQSGLLAIQIASGVICTVLSIGENAQVRWW